MSKMARLVYYCLTIAGLMAFTAGLFATGQLSFTAVRILPSGTPHPAYVQTAYGYDAANDRMIAFGGNTGGDVTNTTSILINAMQDALPPYWIQLHPEGILPASREFPAFGYDQANNRFIVHGGWPNLTDTWVLKNANGLGGDPVWEELPPTSTPRWSAASAYDSRSNRLIVFGGVNFYWYQPVAWLNDVWVLKDANGIGTPQWEELHPIGEKPAPRMAMGSAYDENSNRLIIFGGKVSDFPYAAATDLWILTNANGIGGTPEWIKLLPTVSPWDGPLAAVAPTMAYDPASKHAIVIGGAVPDPYAYSAEIWLLSNADGSTGDPQWTRLSPDTPFATVGHMVAYAPQANRLLLAHGLGGGATWTFWTKDVWLLTNLVVDTTPPTLTDPVASPNILWPANHKMVAVQVHASATDIGDPSPVVKIIGVTCNEPVNGPGDGNTDPDWEITGNLTINLRAERSGSGNGRTYNVIVQAMDASGNRTTKTVTITVPHDMGK